MVPAAGSHSTIRVHKETRIGQLTKETFMLWHETDRRNSCSHPRGDVSGATSQKVRWRHSGSATPCTGAPCRPGTERAQHLTSMACVYCSSLSSIFDTGRGGWLFLMLLLGRGEEE